MLHRARSQEGRVFRERARQHVVRHLFPQVPHKQAVVVFGPLGERRVYPPVARRRAHVHDARAGRASAPSSASSSSASASASCSAASSAARRRAAKAEASVGCASAPVASACVVVPTRRGQRASQRVGRRGPRALGADGLHRGRRGHPVHLNQRGKGGTTHKSASARACGCRCVQAHAPARRASRP